MNEYAPTKEDLESIGGGTAKARGEYTGVISRTVAKKSKKGLLFLGFGLSILSGSLKKQLCFENYLPLSNQASKFQVARRNSFYRAVGIDEGTMPPGAPGGPDPSVLDGTVVKFQLEHVFENVPGEEYDIETSKSSKSRWVIDELEDNLDSNGNLYKAPNGEVILGEDGTPEPIKPRESVVFYSVANEFEGLGSHLSHIEDKKSKPKAERPPQRPAAQRPPQAKRPAPKQESAADEEWGA